VSSHQTHDLPPEKKDFKHKISQYQEAREKKRKFQEWLRAEKAGNKFLNAQVATTFCYCSFYFLPSSPEEPRLKMCATRSHQYKRRDRRRGKGKKKKNCVCKKAMKECWARSRLLSFCPGPEKE
jgi:hypothetical protein